MAEDAVSTEMHGSWGLVRINRPAARNALRVADKLALADAVRHLAARDVRAIVLTATGEKAFCAGTDIKEMAGFSPSEGLRMLQIEADMFDSIMNAPVPVIAAVSGYALGAGCVLAYCCDLAIATTDAIFGQPEVRNGVPAPVQAALLPRVIGLGRARWMLYTGETMTADEAAAAGLIGEVVPSSHLLERAAELAERVAGYPVTGVRLQKRLIDAWIRDPFDAAVKSSPYLASAAFLGDEAALAIKRFLGKNE